MTPATVGPHGPRRTRRARHFVALAAALLAGCGPAEEPEDASAVPTFVGRVDLEIGEVEGDDPYLFARIGSVVADGSGRIFVSDIELNEIRAFDPNGGFLYGFGGSGEGPGELTGPCCLGFDPDGVLWAREMSRYSAFHVGLDGADFERTERVQGPVSNFWAPVTFDTAGRLLDIGPIRVAGGDNILGRLTIGAEGPIDTVLMHQPAESDLKMHRFEFTVNDRPAVGFIYQPFGPGWLRAHGPEGTWAEALSSRYEVRVHSPTGDTVLISRADARGPELSDDERTRALEMIERDKEFAGVGTHPFGVPERKPPLAGLYFDRSGRLWVEASGPDGSEEREAHVYDAEGRHVADYRWPRRVRQGASPWITEDHLYGVTTDSLGVQRAARVRFEPAGS